MHTTSSPLVPPNPPAPQTLLPFQTLLSFHFPFLLHRWMPQAGSPGWAILDHGAAASSGTTVMRGGSEGGRPRGRPRLSRATTCTPPILRATERCAWVGKRAAGGDRGWRGENRSDGQRHAPYKGGEVG